MRLHNFDPEEFDSYEDNFQPKKKMKRMKISPKPTKSERTSKTTKNQH